jgi:hypothetical protein
MDGRPVLKYFNIASYGFSWLEPPMLGIVPENSKKYI